VNDLRAVGSLSTAECAQDSANAAVYFVAAAAVATNDAVNVVVAIENDYFCFTVKGSNPCLRKQRH